MALGGETTKSERTCDGIGKKIVLVMHSTMLDVPHISWGKWLLHDATKASYFRGYDGYDINGVSYR